MTLNLPGQILILTGPPGAGKTTVAKSLAVLSESPAVHLHADDFWRFIVKGAILPYLPAARWQNEVVMGVLASAAVGYAKGDYFAILDGIIGPWFLDAFRTIDAPTHYIVLRPALETSLERARSRGDQFKASGPISELHAQFSFLGALERHVIGNTAQQLEDTLSAVSAALREGSCRL